MKGGVRKRGKKWYYYFDAGVVDGKRKKIERVGGETKKEALDSLRKALNDFDSCGSVVTQTEISFSDYLDYWYKEYVMLNCKYNTQVYYKRTLENHIRPQLGIYKLKNLTPAALQEFINKKCLSGLSKNSMKNILSMLTGSLKQAVHPYAFIKDNPAAYVKMPKFKSNEKEQRIKIISKDDFKKITDRFDFGSSFYIPLQIAFHTGLRGGEICSLYWSNIDLEEGNITVETTLINKGKGIWVRDTPKTLSSFRTVAIGKTLIEILKKHKKMQLENTLKCGKYYTKSEFVCTKQDGSLVTTDSLKYLSRVVNYDLCIPFNFHALRHTHATMLLEAGANIKDIQVRLGHSKLSTTTDTYSHVTENMRQNSVDLFESIIN